MREPFLFYEEKVQTTPEEKQAKAERRARKASSSDSTNVPSLLPIRRQDRPSKPDGLTKQTYSCQFSFSLFMSILPAIRTSPSPQSRKSPAKPLVLNEQLLTNSHSTHCILQFQRQIISVPEMNPHPPHPRSYWYCALGPISDIAPDKCIIRITTTPLLNLTTADVDLTRTILNLYADMPTICPFMTCVALQTASFILFTL